MKQAGISFALTLLLVLAAYLAVQTPHSTRALPAQDDSSACCGQTRPTAPRELDFPYYSLQNGFRSTLNLVSDSPAPLDFTLSVHSSSG
ncbi:MAG TPA: hypothetical protein VG028_07995 [Terriglobia bacterium]|nr:hypothetical protein [Terriglobia bacterium]